MTTAQPVDQTCIRKETGVLEAKNCLAAIRGC